MQGFHHKDTTAVTDLSALAAEPDAKTTAMPMQPFSSEEHAGKIRVLVELIAGALCRPGPRDHGLLI